MSNHPLVFAEENLSHAWGRALLAAIEARGGEIVPLSVTVTGITGGEPAEDSAIRQALDQALVAAKKPDSHTAANLIFPISLWNSSRNRIEFYERCRAVLPRVKAVDRRNCHGVYYERLFAYGPNQINQIEFIILTREAGNLRRSSMQAAVFDPSVDHTNQRQRGFPCLQHVLFTPVGDDGLSVTGIYATQYLFDRAYGNYLGLCRLGRFMAHELGMKLVQMNCYAGVAKLGSVGKGQLEALRQLLQGRLPAVPAAELRA